VFGKWKIECKINNLKFSKIRKLRINKMTSSKLWHISSLNSVCVIHGTLSPFQTWREISFLYYLRLGLYFYLKKICPSIFRIFSVNAFYYVHRVFRISVETHWYLVYFKFHATLWKVYISATIINYIYWF